jgi:hypothetical protein
MPPQWYLVFAAAAGVLLGWAIVYIRAARYIAGRRLEIASLSDECARLVGEVETLRVEERRLRARELLSELWAIETEIPLLRRQLEDLNLLPPPTQSWPGVVKLPRHPLPAVSSEQASRGSDWWREQP